MKYIRTKDGRIIDLTHWTKMPMLCIDKENNLVEEDICYQRQWLEKIGNGDACYVRSESISHKNQALKQADTIEELCDWFVLKEDNKIRVLYDSLEIAITCEGNGIGRYEIIGGIETDRGLIYVAKMNEKGVLELL